MREMAEVKGEERGDKCYQGRGEGREKDEEREDWGK